MYIITGATGNTGHRIAESLLAAGKPVTVVGRSADKLAPLAAKGAHVAVGDLEDAEFLTRTFTGATAVYALIPPNFATPDFRAYQHRVADALTAAVRQSGVRHVVALSSIGAHLPEGAGVVSGLYHFESSLSAIEGVNVVFLRAGFFMENFFGSVGLVNVLNALAGFPIAAHVSMPMVHTQDIAAKATERLLNLDFTGASVQFVAGPRDYSFAEAATILGTAIGKPDLQWLAFPYDQAYAAMVQNGMSEDLAGQYIEFCTASNEGSLSSGFIRNSENTTETRLEDFAAHFAGAYHAVPA